MTPTRPTTSLLFQVLWRVLPAAVLMLLVIWYGAARIMEKTVEDELRAGLQREAEQHATAIAAQFDLLLDAMRVLAANGLLVNGLVDTQERQNYLPTFFQSLRLPGLKGARITLTDYRGRSIAAKGQSESYEQAPWLSEVMDGRDHVSITPDGVIIATPVVYEGLPEGALVVEYAARHIDRLLAGPPSAQDTIVVHESGRVLYSANPTLALAGAPVAPRILEDWVSLVVAVPGQPALSLIAAAHPLVAFKAVKQVQDILLLTVACSLLALGGGILVATFQATRPLSDFVAAIREIGRGGISHRVEAAGPAEFHDLAQHFNEMVERLEQTTVSRDRVDNILNSMAELLIVTDRDCVIQTANQAAREVFKTSEADLRGQQLSRRLRHRETRCELPSLDPRNIAGRVQSIEALCLVGEGRELPVLVSAARLGSEDGAEGSIVYVVLDVTDLSAAEAARAEAEQRLRMAIEAMSEAFTYFDKDDRLVVFNSKYKELYGDQADAVVEGASFQELTRLVHDNGLLVGDYVDIRLSHHSNPKAAVELHHRDGRWLRVHEQRTEDGGVVGVRTDITELKRREAQLERQARELERSNNELAREIGLRRSIEASLRESEAHAQALFEAVGVAVLILDEEAVIERISTAAGDLLGYASSELLGQGLSRLSFAEPAAEQEQGLWQDLARLAKDRPRRMDLRRKDGSWLRATASFGELLLRDRRLFMLVLRERTDNELGSGDGDRALEALDQDLRPALASMLAALQLLKQGAGGRLPETARPMVEAVEKAGAEVLSRFDDLLGPSEPRQPPTPKSKASGTKPRRVSAKKSRRPKPRKQA